MSHSNSHYWQPRNWLSKIISKIRNDFNLDSAKANQFFKSEWELVPSKSNTDSSSCEKTVSLKYLIYRGLYMLILVSCITFSTTCQSHLFHIFLTNWSFTSQNVYAILFFINVLWRYFKINRSIRKVESQNHLDVELGIGNPQEFQELQNLQTKKPNSNSKNCNGHLNSNEEPQRPQTEEQDVDKCCEKSTKLHMQMFQNELLKDGTLINPTDGLTLTYLDKCVWMLINIVHVLPYCVVLGYWCVVYKYDPDQPLCEKFRSHYIVHGATAVLAFFDALIIAIPARPSHFLIPTGLVLFYLIFTFVYEAAGGPYRPGKEFIYSVLDWRSKPSKAFIFSILAVVLTPLAHSVFCYGVYKLRMCLVLLCKRFKKL